MYRFYDELDQWKIDPALANAFSNIVLLRHGESLWNSLDTFTGWTDVPITLRGGFEARAAGRKMADLDLQFDVVFTSYLQRTTVTASICTAELGQPDVEVQRRWELNERHYGALTGLNKKLVKRQLSKDQFARYHADPPPLQPSSPYFPGNDPTYSNINPELLPLKESFEDTKQRIGKLWDSEILPAAKQGKKLLIVTSKNALRGLLMHLSDLSYEHVKHIDIPNATPFKLALPIGKILSLENDPRSDSSTCVEHDAPVVESDPDPFTQSTDEPDATPIPVRVRRRSKQNLNTPKYFL